MERVSSNYSKIGFSFGNNAVKTPYNTFKVSFVTDSYEINVKLEIHKLL